LTGRIKAFDLAAAKRWRVSLESRMSVLIETQMLLPWVDRQIPKAFS